MSNFARTLLIILTGLFTAQIIATFHVFLSNAELLDKVTVLSEQGYLTIPGKHNVHALAEMAPAFVGGLFISLTAGAGISILSLSGFLLWSRYRQQGRIILSSYLLALAFILAAINHNGFNISASSYFVLVPAMVAASARKLWPAQCNKQSQAPLLVAVVAILIVAPLIGWFAGTGVFVEIRDRVLMSNSIGAALNNVYYKYTLYPAEAIKTLDQKTLKTVAIDVIVDPSHAQTIQRKLMDRNYLMVEGGNQRDLKIGYDDGYLLFSHRGNVLVRTTIGQFVLTPERILSEFSDRSDRNAFFREFISYSLVWAVPAIIFMVLYCIFRLIFDTFVKARTSSIIASAFCLVIGISFLIFSRADRFSDMDLEKILTVLENGDSSDRIRALKIAVEKGFDISNFSDNAHILQSQDPAERYWLLRALATSRNSELPEVIISSIDDPHPNVACMAYYAVGKSGNSDLIDTVIEGIGRTDSWYVQLYAYNALMDLGWRQSRASGD